jgi:hypothetical protein
VVSVAEWDHPVIRPVNDVFDESSNPAELQRIARGWGFVVSLLRTRIRPL